MYRKHNVRNLDPGFPGMFLDFPYVSLVFPGKSKKFPDPGRNLQISYHTAEPYLIFLFFERVLEFSCGSGA